MELGDDLEILAGGRRATTMQMPGGFHEHENDMADSDFEPATATTGTDSEEEYDMEFEGDEVDDEDIDAELAEAERLARAADDSDLDPDDIEEDAQGDRTGGSLQLGLNSMWNASYRGCIRTWKLITSTAGRGQLFVLSADGEATPISQSLLSSIPGLRQLIADSGVLGGADQDGQLTHTHPCADLEADCRVMLLCRRQ